MTKSKKSPRSKHETVFIAPQRSYRYAQSNDITPLKVVLHRERRLTVTTALNPHVRGGKIHHLDVHVYETILAPVTNGRLAYVFGGHPS